MESFITPKQAAERLGVTISMVHRLARQGRLSRACRDGKNVFVKSHVDALTNERYLHKRCIHNLCDKRDIWGDQTIIPELTDGDELISTTAAGEILGVSKEAICRLVRHGVLPGYQKYPGKSGSPVLVRRMAVALLAERPEYLELRRRVAKSEMGVARDRNDKIRSPYRVP